LGNIMDSNELRGLAAEALALAEKANPGDAATLRTMARGLLEMSDTHAQRGTNNKGN
jgi:hypothetical protein